MLFQASPNWPQLFEWAYAHVGIVGYPALAAFMWKAATIFNDIKNTVIKTVGQVDHMATNHFPHMQESLQKQDGFLESMDSSLRTMVERMPEKVKKASKKN